MAKFYDELTKDVCYDDFLNYYKTEFKRDGGEFRLILDLCCGTGTLTNMMNESGYEMISVDSSEDMLIEAREKCPDALFICQDVKELDLFGTVDACYSSLDSINYIKSVDLDAVFKRLSYFIRPGGLFIFDIRTSNWLRQMDGMTSVDENDEMLCLWRADFVDDYLLYGMDIFKKQGKLWSRDREEHIEYAHELETLEKKLRKNGFIITKTYEYKTERLFITAKRK